MITVNKQCATFKVRQNSVRLIKGSAIFNVD